MKKSFLVIILLALISQMGFGQVQIFAHQDRSTMVCVWPKVGLRDQPGKSGNYLAGIHYGEQVQKLGEEAYLPSEKRTYQKVKLADGNVGWVHEYLFVTNGIPVVILEPARLYQRPNSPSTATQLQFEAGDIVVMETMAGDWLSLVGPEKKKSGWIQGQGNVTDNSSDVEMATLMKHYLREKNPEKREIRVNMLLAEMERLNSPLVFLYRNRTPRGPASNPPQKRLIASSDRQVPSTQQQQRMRGRSADPQPHYRNRSVNTPPSTANSVVWVEEDVIWDVWQPFQRQDAFRVAHKHLPVGTKIRLHFPDTQGYVELIVDAKLPSDAPHDLGLTNDCIQMVFGNMIWDYAKISFRNR
ncbi:hypothetical protein [Pontibacter sp. G13]|uniref:SH3 domain-containing protein n=1 Tax=Pontibacter sp. G13 TaxID=3074898 RepID=UPI00288BA9B1|nr:hypothetical protein [Pontibacter sp. G13]WNJ16332.1 hypothetical protein RJD25_15820 [Pontibacter sp. G13]